MKLDPGVVGATSVISGYLLIFLVIMAPSYGLLATLTSLRIFFISVAIIEHSLDDL